MHGATDESPERGDEMTITRANYEAHPGVSQSELRDLARSPAHYYAIRIARTVPRAESSAMRIGSALHALVLEPIEFQRGYVVQSWDARTKEGKAARDAAMASGRVVLDSDDARAVAGMGEALSRHADASRILAQRTHTEYPMTWRDDASGLRCKGRIDCLATIAGRAAIVDIKTTTDASPDAFARSIATYGYHVQAAHYLAGMRANGASVDGFVILAVESRAPYGVAVYELDAEALEVGEERRRALLSTLAECRASGRWPGYRTQTISLPRWAVREVEHG